MLFWPVLLSGWWTTRYCHCVQLCASVLHVLHARNLNQWYQDSFCVFTFRLLTSITSTLVLLARNPSLPLWGYSPTSPSQASDCLPKKATACASFVTDMLPNWTHTVSSAIPVHPRFVVCLWETHDFILLSVLSRMVSHISIVTFVRSVWKEVSSALHYTPPELIYCCLLMKVGCIVRCVAGVTCLSTPAATGKGIKRLFM